MIVSIRERRPLTDDGFIFSSWLTSTLNASRELRDNSARAARHAEIRQTLRDNRCVVAHAPGDDDAIVGYGVEQQGRLVWVYVKHVFRRAGVAGEIAAALGCDWPPRSDAQSPGQPSPGIAGGGDSGPRPGGL